jgi:hypothetical protein
VLFEENGSLCVRTCIASYQSIKKAKQAGSLAKDEEEE